METIGYKQSTFNNEVKEQCKKDHYPKPLGKMMRI